MSTRILHVSDLHLGARKERDTEALAAALVATTERLDPELVVASGDLAHRGSVANLGAAHELLGGLGRPLLVVPGNHDMPLWPPTRIAAPWRAFEQVFGTTEPEYSSPALRVVGLNSARPFRHQGGRIGTAQLERGAARLADAAPGAFRLAVFHHNLVSAPWRVRKRPLDRRATVLARLAEAGAELIVGGHIHQVTGSETREFLAGVGTVVVTTAPGLGAPRPQRRGEARGALAYLVGDDSITVETYMYDRAGFELRASRRFPRPPAARGDGPEAVLTHSSPA
jgi:3',5'-cyclic AMP phosphodiesterase CpdA